MIKICKLSKENFEQALELRYEMLMNLNNLKADVLDDKFKAATKEYFSNGDQTTFLAVDGESVIGCATICFINVMPTYSHPTGERAHIMNVFVKEKYRKKGIARKMMEEIILLAVQKKVTHVSLDATAEGRYLYEKIGFLPASEGMELILKYDRT